MRVCVSSHLIHSQQGGDRKGESFSLGPKLFFLVKEGCQSFLGMWVGEGGHGDQSCFFGVEGQCVFWVEAKVFLLFILRGQSFFLEERGQSFFWVGPNLFFCEHLARPFFTVNYPHTHDSSLGPHSFHHIHASCVLWSLCLTVLSSTTPLFFLHHLLFYHPVISFARQLHLPGCGGQIPLCTSVNEDFDTLAEYDPLTGYDPNDYHITETCEHYTQEFSVE